MIIYSCRCKVQRNFGDDWNARKCEFGEMGLLGLMRIEGFGVSVDLGVKREG